MKPATSSATIWPKSQYTEALLFVSGIITFVREVSLDLGHERLDLQAFESVADVL